MGYTVLMLRNKGGKKEYKYTFDNYMVHQCFSPSLTPYKSTLDFHACLGNVKNKLTVVDFSNLEILYSQININGSTPTFVSPGFVKVAKAQIYKNQNDVSNFSYLKVQVPTDATEDSVFFGVLKGEVILSAQPKNIAQCNNKEGITQILIPNFSRYQSSNTFYGSMPAYYSHNGWCIDYNIVPNGYYWYYSGLKAKAYQISSFSTSQKTQNKLSNNLLLITRTSTQIYRTTKYTTLNIKSDNGYNLNVGQIGSQSVGQQQSYPCYIYDKNKVKMLIPVFLQDEYYKRRTWSLNFTTPRLNFYKRDLGTNAYYNMIMDGCNETPAGLQVQFTLSGSSLNAGICGYATFASGTISWNVSTSN